MSDKRRFLLGAAALGYGVLAMASALVAGSPEVKAAPIEGVEENRCLDCHDGIEDMHPDADLSCVDCHGGDASGKNKFEAHIRPTNPIPGDERTLPLDQELAYLRFRNPMDLRVVDKTCGDCHQDLCTDLKNSLHGTTAGHLSDGFYEMGLVDEPGSKYGIFELTQLQAGKAEGEIDSLLALPKFQAHKTNPRDIGSYYADLPRKECMQCHLYSEGRAVRGRLGFDGDYRGEGCAACHVEYALDGLSDTADRTVNRNEPGHPFRHEMTRAPKTETCTACHYGDASIGLHFRGLSQLPPGAPGGPDIDGTTDTLLNRTFYMNDPEICPPDVHHERGMHCVDCHTLGDIMGDGRLHGQMEHAVEISCEACHGTFKKKSSLKTERGTPLEHLFEDGGEVFLRSKVTGKVHPLKQVVDVLDEDHRHFNPEAAEAMTEHHGDVECYTCHAGWNVNFLGFHFYRNEALSQLDILTGKRTPGRVTTQEKVFTTWKSFYAGLNEEGKVAPYLTGFSTMGTVDDAEGKRIFDQAMPVTRAGLSGVTMVHHQLHSVRPTARTCIECHRSPATWGLGSSNFKLGRQMAFVADRRGVEVVAIDRGQLAASTPLAKFVLPDVVDLELDCDPLQGHAETLYVAEGQRGIHVLDVREPTAPDRVAFVESISPRGMALAGDFLFSADGIGGLRVYDVSKPEKIERVGVVPMFDAQDVEIRWPYAYVADGPGGLVILDIRDPIQPRVVGGLGLVEGSNAVNNTVDVDLLFQYSRPEADFAGDPAPFRTEARHLAAVVDEEAGLYLVDVTEPTHPEVIWPRPDRSGRTAAQRRRGDWEYRGVVMRSHVDLASPQGGTKTAERDYAYLLEERLLGNGDSRSRIVTVDVSDPKNPDVAGTVDVGDQSEGLVHGSFYNQPFLQPVAMVPGDDGVFLADLTVSEEPTELGVFQGLRSSYMVALEEFPLDQMIDVDGERLKDISRRPSRWLYRAEIERILDVSGYVLGSLLESDEQPDVPGSSARAYFARLDKNRDGLLTEKEADRAGRAFDVNDDGRITLAELAEEGRSFEGDPIGTTTEGPPVVQSNFANTRVDLDGDLSRLFDGVDPYEFDRDDDSRLDRKELSLALFAALDLDGSGRLTLAELSRHPGELRQLRYGDTGALKKFGLRDLNKGGSISSRELKVTDRDWDALDADGDGGVQLPVYVDRRTRNAGLGPRQSEWPRRQNVRVPLPPIITPEKLMEFFDADEDGYLSNRELSDREDLRRIFDQDGDGRASRDEVGRISALVVNGGVDATTDAFDRWDLNGDGEVGEGELPDAVLQLLERREWSRKKR